MEPDQKETMVARSTQSTHAHDDIPLLHSANIKHASLPIHQLDSVEITETQKRLYKEEARNTLEQAIQGFRQFEQKDSEVLESWKHMRRKHDVDIYRLRRTRRKAPPVLVAHGSALGNMDDLIYAEYTDTTAQFQHKNAFVSPESMHDSKVLCNIETREDTQSNNNVYRYLGIKWALSRAFLPGMNWIVKARDWLFWEAVGVTIVPDFMNKQNAPIRVGYHIMRPCELRSVPPFPTAMRGRLGLVNIYYQSSPGVIRVYSQASIDFAGEVASEQFAVGMTMASVTRVFAALQYAETLKLTTFSNDVVNLHPSPIDTRTNRAESWNPAQCTLCQREVGTALQKLTKSIKACGICGSLVCAKCRVHKKILTAHGKESIRCCQQCLLSSKMVVACSESSQSSTFWEPSGSFSSVSASARIRANSSQCVGSDPVEENHRSQRSPSDAGIGLKIPTQRQNLGPDDRNGDSQSSSQSVDVFSSELPTANKLDDRAVVAHTLSTTSCKSLSDLQKLRKELRTSSINEGSQTSVETCEEEWETIVPYNSVNPVVDTGVNVSPYQVHLYEKMIALQHAAETAYKLTQATQDKMKY
ncbi:unnamed protein product [Albugo candida]|uniref:FYVE-type domain-containing protein n=1 Tax=Albugo candida TaxID=65357 RepID=A0A024GL20_9STRA|nr:unnamed protein product [Albugo candida]|eukprot:CCI47036.1 unnamed protein product [Albugo candida]